MYSLRGQGGVVAAVVFVIVFGILFYAFLNIWAPIQNDVLIPELDDPGNDIENAETIKFLFLAGPFFIAVLAVLAVFIIAGQKTSPPQASVI